MMISWTVFKLQNYRADGIVFCSQQSQGLRGITQKIYIQELWFLRSAHRLLFVNISMTFHEDILNIFLSYRATERMALYSVLGIAKVQRGITQKIYIQEFLRSAHRRMLVNISMTFHEDNYLDRCSSCRATERTALYSALGIAKVQRGITKNIYPRVMALAICTLSNVG